MENHQLTMLGSDEALRQRNFLAYRNQYGVSPAVDPEENRKYLMTRAENGALLLCIRMSKDGENWWVPVNDQKDPMAEAMDWARNLRIPNRRTTIALLGFSMGYQVAALQSFLRPDTRVMVYEPQEGLFAFVCGFIDLTELFSSESRVTVIVPSCPMWMYYQQLEDDALANHSQVLGIRLPYYKDDWMYETVCRRIHSTVEGNRAYQKTTMRTAMRNRLYAWTRLASNAMIQDLLARIPAELPVIIVAAGPSLIRNVDLLRELKGHALIVCVDRAAQILDQHGVIPDLLVTMDAKKDASYLMASYAEKIPLLCSLQGTVDAQKAFEGRIIYFHAQNGECLLPGVASRMIYQAEVCGNVAGAAFVAFLAHGSQSIILIGQDLAMSGKESHADGSHIGISGDDHILFAQGIDGKPVATRRDWVGFREEYEHMIRRYPASRVIDATEGGARIQGTEVMTLREAADSICTGAWEVDALFHDLPMAQSESEHAETMALFRQWQAELAQIESDCRELVRIMEKLVKICRYHDIREKKHDYLIKKQEQLRRRIYGTRVFVLLEWLWVEDQDTIPDRALVIRSNEEALPVFEEALAYYRHLPEDCRSLSEAIQAVIDECED